MSALSRSTELTVRCENGIFIWSENGRVITHSAEDPAGAADLILSLYHTPEQSTGRAAEPAADDG